ncbi:MAG: acyl-CoA synthetase [Pseudomonadota bacterium]
MHPSHHAKSKPEHQAIIMAGSGTTRTYAELERRSNQIAHALRSLGLQAGDHIAFQLGNCVEFLELVVGAQRAGLVYTPISTHLLQEEVRYIVGNCRAKLLITSPEFEQALTMPLDGTQLEARLIIRGSAPGFASFEALVDEQPDTPIADEQMGIQMLYSSGTTGLPKGVLAELKLGTPIDEPHPVALALVQAFGISAESRYLSTAPLYHAAPITFAVMTLSLGGTVVIMEKFDAEAALRCIEQYHITHSQWVPIMFVRMLKLPEDVRNRYNLSTHRVAVHGAAPCPVGTKHAMIEWWGPVLAEYYASTEGAGFTAIDAQTWLQKPGSVGKSRSDNIHILDDEGNELTAGEVGTIYFSGIARKFEYFDEADKTTGAYNRDGWATVGDVGYLDEDGFLFLTDRKNYMIITGGVNVYPQEVENLLLTHPAVADAAVFGIPHEEFGEAVHAVVQPVADVAADADMEATLIGFMREHLSSIKVPKRVDFSDNLPRHDNGKLYKRRLVEQYQRSA